MADRTVPLQPPAVKRLARQLLKTGALRLVGFIVARPRLDAFLRRQIYRFPGLAGRARAAIARSRRASGQALPVILTEEADLTDSARQVLQALERAIDHTRPT
jgi:hypothetical protein